MSSRASSRTRRLIGWIGCCEAGGADADGYDVSQRLPLANKGPNVRLTHERCVLRGKREIAKEFRLVNFCQASCWIG